MELDDLLPGESLSLRLHGERLRVVLDFGLDVSPLKHFITAASSNNTWLQQPDGTPSLAAASLTSEVLAKNSTKVIRPLLPGRPRVHLPRDCHPSTFAQYSDVDAVLVSSVQGMMALPFLVDMFHQADMHVPRILATEPVKEYARLAMEELVRAIDRCELMPREKRGWFDEVDARAAEILAAGLDTSVVRRWMPMYSMAQVDECMRHVETVAYGQYIRLTDGCTVCARSSGYALGSAHWLLKIQSFTLAYCNRTSLEMGRLADPFLLDAIKSDRDLTDITFLVLNGRLDNVSAGNATDATTVKSLTYSEQVGRVAETISRTLFRGGMVLLPLTASPDSLDVLDAIHAHVHSSSSLRFQTTLVSPVIRRLLLRIGINTEWTPNVEQTLAKVLQYQMDGQDAPQRTGSQPPRSIAPTFGEAKLGSSGRHLVVADHPNMLIGDAQWIAEWARGRNDAILVVHTDPLHAPSITSSTTNDIHLPVTATPSPNEWLNIIQAFHPHALLLPQSWSTHLAKSEITTRTDVPLVMYYRAGKPVNIKYQSKATFVRALAPNLNTIAGDMLTTLLPMIDDHGDAIIVPLRIHFEKSGSVVVVVRDGSGVCPPDPVDPLPQSRVVPSMLVQWIAERLALEGIGVREVTSRQAGDRRMIEMILDVERASISVVRSTTTMDGLDIVMSSDNADLRRRIMGRLSVV